MIKNALLSRKCRKLVKNQSTNHPTYRDATNIGIFYNSMEFSRELVEELEDGITGDGKEVTKLSFSEKENSDPFSFCKKDISVSGNLKKDSIGSFTRQAFDFLISLDTSGDINFKYVVALSKATCKVGVNSDAYGDVLLMTIKDSGNQSQDVKELLKYLKMI